MARRRNQLVSIAAALLFGLFTSAAHAQPVQVNTIQDVFLRLKTCWKPPPASRAHPGIDITVVVSFNRNGEILGHPKITYESEHATDNDRLMYRVAVMGGVATLYADAIYRSNGGRGRRPAVCGSVP